MYNRSDSYHNKAQIRSHVLKIRDDLKISERIEKTLNACTYARNLFKFKPDDVVAGFFPIHSEIDPFPLMNFLYQNGTTLCMPVVLDKELMVFREIESGVKLINAGFGTKGPGLQARVVNPNILLMPLSAFDDNGGRIGYGAGYYDRAIARLEDMNILPKLIGMAFNCQKVAKVPVEPHDKKLDFIVTESGFSQFY